ncbi:MAG: amidohydrolase family protein [Thermodesulfobacteriota bacterium]|nr:amidohydrolase family protein [Thermodesulfobacteriota bacterium]
MIIDFHTHIFPEKIRLEREKYFTGEPAFKLLYDSLKSKLVGSKELINTMDDEEVDISVVFGFPWNNGEIAKENNDYIMESVARYPDRLKGFACFDMSWQGAPDEAQRCINAGLSGVGELAFYLSGIDNNALLRLEPVMEICKKSGNLPVMIHTNEPVGHKYPGKTPVTLEQIYSLAEHFPDNRIVLAHWGGGIFFYNLLKKEAKDVLKNIWFDTAASPFLYDPAVYKAACDTGIAEKVLFGTDYPLLKPARYYKELDESGVSESSRKQILGENASLLLGLR